jgi:hypothetical protein
MRLGSWGKTAALGLAKHAFGVLGEIGSGFDGF